MHPNFISKALTAVTSVPTEADMAESCSLPEQELVPLASGLRKGVDERMHCVTAEKNLGGEWLQGVRKSVGLSGSWAMGRRLAYRLPPLCSPEMQSCSIFRCLQLPEPPPKTHRELFSPPWAVWQCPSHPLVSALPSASRAASPSLKPFPYTME